MARFAVLLRVCAAAWLVLAGAPLTLLAQPFGGNGGGAPANGPFRPPAQGAFAPPPAASRPMEVSSQIGRFDPVLRDNSPGSLQPPTSASELFKAAETAARVGDEYIFQGELIGDVNIMMAPVLLNAKPADLPGIRAQIDSQRRFLEKQLLTNAIDRKLMYVEFLRNLAHLDADKRQEARAGIESDIADNFRDKLFEVLDKVNRAPEQEQQALAQQSPRLFRMAILMKQQNLTSLGQLDDVLRRLGSSLVKQREAYGEQLLGRQQLGQKIDREPEITIDEMRAYYDQNNKDFHVPARAKWEQITIRFSHCASKEEAGRQIRDLGNELALGGTPFWAVAKRSSHGVNAAKGGFHDWTEWGHLEVSREINHEVFNINLNELSDIVEDNEGLHIVRVLAREPARVIPFTEAQVDIKESLQREKRNRQITEYLTRLREQTPIWKPLTDANR